MPRRVAWIASTILGLVYLSIRSTRSSDADSDTLLSRVHQSTFRSKPRPAAALVASLPSQQNAEVPLADSNWPWDPHSKDPLLDFCIYDSSNYSKGRTALTSLPDGTGSVRGIRCSHSDVGLEAFLGIPYAKSPVGSRRFAAPALLDQDKERVWDAKRFSKMCSQPAVCISSICFLMGIVF